MRFIDFLKTTVLLSAAAATALAAIEERDGASFYVRRTSPVRPMELMRTPGFKTLRHERVNGAIT